MANPPNVWGDAVVLRSPRRRVVDPLAVDLQPLAHLPQTLLKYGRDHAVRCGTDVHQQVSTAGHRLRQRLTHKQFIMLLLVVFFFFVPAFCPTEQELLCLY